MSAWCESRLVLPAATWEGTPGQAKELQLCHSLCLQISYYARNLSATNVGQNKSRQTSRLTACGQTEQEKAPSSVQRGSLGAGACCTGRDEYPQVGT